ncbi:MAG TPA: PAS domain S-box protein, partial [Gemmatimonadaceae bacterium]
MLVPAALPLLQTVQLNTTGHHGLRLRLTGIPALVLIVATLVGIVFAVVRFVSLRRAARRAAAQRDAAEAELRTLFEAMDDLVAVIDHDGRLIRLPLHNPRATTHIGGARVGQTVSDVLPSAVADAIIDAVRGAIIRKTSVRTNYTLTIDGAVRWLAATMSPLDPHSAVCVVRDFTESRLARDELARSEERYRLFFEGNPSAMWIYDVETTHIVEANHTAVLQYGYTAEEFTQLDLAQIRPAEDRVLVPEILRSTPRDGLGVHISRHVKKDGTVMDVEVRGQPLDIPGRSLRLVTSIDVTERVAAERAAHEAEARANATLDLLQSLIDVAPQAMIVVDTDWHLTRWNLAAHRLFGWTAEEVLGRPVPFVPEDQRDLSRHRQSRADQGVFETPHEVVRMCKDGRRIDVMLATAPLSDAAGARVGYVASYTDLTERNHLESQLRQSQKMEAIGTLAGGIAHDFNNILTIISSYSSMLLGDAKGKGTKPELEEIATAAQRAAALTRQLLTFSRKAIVQPRPLDLNEVMCDMESMLRRLVMEHIEFVWRPGSDIGTVVADPSQIEQIIMNLVVNAGDAMPDGGSLVVESQNVELDEAYARMHVDVTPGHYVMLSVTDTGVGIDRAVIDKIFEPFFTTKEVGRGTGLGLATVYANVKQVNGHIWVYSEPGQGAAFKIYFPRVVLDGVDEAPSSAAKKQFRTGTVLLVEDDDDVRRATRRVLEMLGYSVLEASNGEEGLASASTHAGSIDVVVTDLMMPKMNGGDLARALAISHPTLRIVFTSGY